MSMNLHLQASILAHSKVGAHEIINRFNLYQTPTEVTERAIRSQDPKQVYLDWIRERFGDEIIKHAAHLEELEHFLNHYRDWNIEWYEM